MNYIFFKLSSLYAESPLRLTTVQKSWSFYTAYVASKSYIRRDGT